MPSYIVNPLTGRKILVGGSTYNKVFNKKGKGKCKKFRKTKDPKCNDQPGCKWVVKKGCLDKVPTGATKVTSRTNGQKKIKCKKFRKTKDPKCNDQPKCKWVKKKGCLDKVPTGATKVTLSSISEHQSSSISNVNSSSSLAPASNSFSSSVAPTGATKMVLSNSSKFVQQYTGPKNRYNGKSPKLKDVKQLVSVVVYDLLVKNKRKTIVFFSEYHELKNSPQAKKFCDEFINFLRKNHKNDCLDVHFEWALTVNNSNDTPAGLSLNDMYALLADSNLVGNGLLNTYAERFIKNNKFKQIKNVRIHRDDLRHAYFDEKQTTNNYKQFYYELLTKEMAPGFTDEVIIALYFGIGPAAKNGNPNKKSEKIIKKFIKKVEDEYDNVGKQISYQELNKIRKKSRKTLTKFMKEFKISEVKLYMTMKKSLAWSNRPGKGNFSIEAVNDIYSFMRMFRTFDESKRGNKFKPCSQDDQTNIVYISHFGHAAGIWLLLKEIFNVEPSYYDAHPDWGYDFKTRKVVKSDDVVKSAFKAIDKTKPGKTARIGFNAYWAKTLKNNKYHKIVDQGPVANYSQDKSLYFYDSKKKKYMTLFKNGIQPFE